MYQFKIWSTLLPGDVINNVMNMYLYKCSHKLMKPMHSKFNDDILARFIARVSEVIMFSPCVCVSVCFCLSIYVCHDVYPDDLTMKDWCHTNNILQVHCWGCLVVQVMFYALMTSLMTSQGHKVGQILQLIYLPQYLSYSVDQKLKMSEMPMAIFLVYSTSGIISGKKFVAAILKIFKHYT